jgi:hypothetical protein
MFSKPASESMEDFSFGREIFKYMEPEDELVIQPIQRCGQKREARAAPRWLKLMI